MWYFHNPQNSYAKPHTTFPNSDTSKRDILPMPAETLVPSQPYPKQFHPNLTPNSSKPTYATPQPITAFQRDESKAKGLCYYCDEKYTLEAPMQEAKPLWLLGKFLVCIPLVMWRVLHGVEIVLKLTEIWFLTLYLLAFIFDIFADFFIILFFL